MNWRRLVDAFVVAAVVLTGAQSLREAPGILMSEGLQSWRSVVAVAQLVAGVGAAILVVAFWRRRQWLTRGAIMWGAGGIVAGPVATFAWGSFVRAGFLGALAGTLLMAGLVFWWSIVRSRTGRADAPSFAPPPPPA